MGGFNVQADVIYIQGRSEKVKAWQEAFMYSKEMYVEYSVE